MPPRPSPAPIVARERQRQGAALWQALAPASWPLPPQALPPDTVLVGGAVRDGLLGRLPQCPDLDLIVPGDAIPLARDLARRLGGSSVVLDRERSIARLVLQGWTIDLARCMGRDLAADLARRDFTVNAIALPLPADSAAAEPSGLHLVDPHDGLKHLEARQLVAIAEENLIDDPLRLLRGVRLATELDFTIDPLTRRWIQAHHRRIGTVAGERVLAELVRLAEAPDGQRGLALAIGDGLLRPWTATTAVAGSGVETDAIERLDLLNERQAALLGLSTEEGRWALKLARLASVLDGAAIERLHGSRELARNCRLLRHWLERLRSRADRSGRSLAAPPAGPLDGLTEEEIFDLQRNLEGILPALLLCQPIGAGSREAMRRWRDPRDPLFHPRPPLGGDLLQRLVPLAPGPTLGQLIDHLTRERAFARLQAPAAGSDADEQATEATLAAARSWLAARTMRHD